MTTSQGDDVRLGPIRQDGCDMYYRDPLNSNLPVGNDTDNSVLIINNNRTHGGFITPNQLTKLLPV